MSSGHFNLAQHCTGGWPAASPQTEQESPWVENLRFEGHYPNSLHPPHLLRGGGKVSEATTKKAEPTYARSG